MNIGKSLTKKCIFFGENHLRFHRIKELSHRSIIPMFEKIKNRETLEKYINARFCDESSKSNTLEVKEDSHREDSHRIVIERYFEGLKQIEAGPFFKDFSFEQAKMKFHQEKVNTVKSIRRNINEGL